MRPFLATALLILATGPALAAPREVTGSVTYAQRVALPPEAEVLLAFQDKDGLARDADSFAAHGQQVPLGFVTGVPEGTQSLSAAVFLGTTPLWQGGPLPVPPGAGPVTLPALVLSPVPEGQAGVWTCAGQPVEVGFAGAFARMNDGNATQTLVQAQSGSGAKYAVIGDPGVWVWSKGADLTVSFGGDTAVPCTIGASAAGVTANTLTARGNEPGWRADLAGDTVQLHLQDGGAQSFARPAPEAVAGGRRYTLADGVALTITEGLCRDSMTGMPHPAQATLTEGGRDMTGCAGDPMALLEGPEWQVAQIDGAAVLAEAPVTMTFEDGRAAGTGGCNRWFAEVRLSGEGLSFGPAGATMMACPEAQMAQERRFLATLDQVDGFDIDDTGALHLTSGGRPVVTARR